jgi:acid phosphatase (class A)
MTRFAKSSPALLICLLLLAAAPSDSFVTPEQFNFDAIIGKPPADYSPAHTAEVDQMLAMQEHRTPEEVKRCQSEEKVTPFVFSEILGDWFNAKDLPATAQFFRKGTTEATEVSTAAKDKYARVRPPVADKRIHPCVALEKTGSFPSGHATRGVVWATLLSDIFPDKKDALMARGKLIGQDRVIGGMHYPSDVAAGQKLGAAIAKKMMENERFKAEFEKVKEECHNAAFAHQ